MLLAIVENDSLDDYWAKHCKFTKTDILEPKQIQKPYEDVNDAYLIYMVIKKENQS